MRKEKSDESLNDKLEAKDVNRKKHIELHMKNEEWGRLIYKVGFYADSLRIRNKVPHRI